MALTMFITFLLLAVGGRIAIQYKLTGDHGIRPINPNSTKIALLSSILLLTSFLSVFILTLLDAIGILEPQITPGRIIEIAAITLSLTGIVLTIISQYQMGTAWRIGVDESEQTELVTNGIYSLIRNPIYSGVMLFGVGLLFLLPNIYMLLSILIGYLSIELHVRYVEEPYLLRLHGPEFENYMNKTDRYLPRFIHGA